MLLMPNKNSHPDLTVLAVSGFLLGSIKKSKFESYSDLLESLILTMLGRIFYLNRACSCFFFWGWLIITVRMILSSMSDHENF